MPVLAHRQLSAAPSLAHDASNAIEVGFSYDSEQHDPYATCGWSVPDPGWSHQRTSLGWRSLWRRPGFWITVGAILLRPVTRT